MLNLPENAASLPLEYKWFFSYYKKYGPIFDNENKITDEELMTPLTESEKDELQNLA